MNFFYQSALLNTAWRHCRNGIVLIALLKTANTYGQRSEPFSFNCVVAGQQMRIDAEVSNASASSFYHWQYKTGTAAWKCFVNGVNTINGADFDVSGSTKNGGANDAPVLMIDRASSALENVMIRLLIGNGADPCVVLSPVWGGDDQSKHEAKYLRLHVYGSEMECPPNSYSCPGNRLVDGPDYYGGFEHIAYNSSNASYSRRNFGSYASTDLSFGTGPGSYQDINNPYAMNSAFARDIAPHSGNFQMVVNGPANSNARAWFKNNIPVVPGSQYRFAVWVARIDDTDPVISLKIKTGNNTINLVSYDMYPEPVGNWRLIQGNYSVPSGVNQIDISVGDTETGGLNNYVLDDICFRECFNCGTLPLHQLELRAYLQGNTVNLKWIAENEMNTASFVIERSLDGINYTGIASKLPTGPLNTPTTYQFDDNISGLSTSSSLYYRIKAMDNDSRFAYSNVTTIKLGNTTGIQVWPNPADTYVNLTYNASSSTTLEICLVNSQGVMVRQESVKVSRGLNQLSLKDITRLPSGIYLIRIIDTNTGKMDVQKISK
jgi:hypothetical protein